MPLITKIAESLDWPEAEADGEAGKVTVECAGRGFVAFYELYQASGGESEDEMWAAKLAKDAMDRAEDESSTDENGSENGAALPPAVDLFSLSEKELEEIDYYKVLQLPCLPSVTPDDVKKAYRKSCLKYHPDKSGRGEEDAVFLKVKAAFETLSTQKIAYDSTEMPFNDSIPSDNKIAKHDFFELFRPVFDRNMHFDSRLLPSNQNNNGGKRNNRRKNGSTRNLKCKKQQGPPALGDANTPIEEVHEFYDYWIHFESWRDYSLQAARELETEDHLENAESRYEKRWLQKEVDRAAKKLKQHEVARISLLVEKAMAADPRMIQEKKRLIEEKEKKQRDREQAARDKKKAEEDAKRAAEQKVEEEKKRKAEEKMAKEQEKKKLRKAKQAFKKYVAAALEELGEKEYALEDEIDLICTELDRLKLTKLNSLLDSKPAAGVVSIVKKRTESIKNGLDGDDEEVDNSKCDADSTSKPTANGSLTNGHSKEQTKTAPPTTSTSAPKKKTATFTKDEMTALAKGVKKFPAGGANRWDQISNYINNVCRPENPRTKEECIEVYNKTAKSAKSFQNGNKSQMSPASATTSTADKKSGEWTAEQDQQLQQGLSTYPSSMDKNERWSSIATLVKGKSKKECVARFKEIRNALKAKK
mmetsp:Transcript_22445/g.52986  ORF Transcript_22445/g.52986 Transcript_22445/m.52986 type:complete len:646 (-) Transcript_22445:97-2034(-)